MGRTTPNFDYAETMALTDAVLINTLIDGEVKTRQIVKSNFIAGGDVVPVGAGNFDLVETEHLGRLLNIDNSAGAVRIVLPDHGSFHSYGLVCLARISTGSQPVSVAVQTTGQLAAPQPSQITLVGDEVFVGPRTDLGDEMVFAIIRSGDGIWTVDSPYGVRSTAGEDNTLEGADPGTLAVFDEGNSIAGNVVSMNFAGLGVTVTSPGAGQVLVTINDTNNGETTLTFSDPLPWDVTAAPRGKVTLTGATTINAEEIVNGSTYALVVVQDATGGRVLTFGSGFADIPAVNIEANGITVMRFYATGGVLHSFDNIGDGEKISDLNAIGTIAAAADKLIIERDSDKAPFDVTPAALFGAIVPPVTDTDDRILTDGDHNSIIEITGATPAISVPLALTPGFVCTLVKTAAGTATIAGTGGLTVEGDLALTQNHFATIYRGTAVALSRVSG